ncbi:MAG: pyrroline-5-carboxylate reductase [Planctomycetes bacterium HGW-Planctomycetes-1]|nr:MAG: pyrroline-5-carboxylate reductase [Planctomycetes bacterium HGW-Planctomycetes-1]
MAKIGFVGAGNMAEAIIKGVIDAKVYKSNNIIISDIRPQRVKTVCKKYKVKSADNCKLAKTVNVLVLSVKPQNMADILKEIKKAISKNILIVSIAAGVTTKKIQKTLGNIAVVRVMPNTPALIGQGAAAIFATKKAKAKVKNVLRIFSAVGLAVEVGDEKLMDAVTAVSGSGPAYFFLLMEAMLKAAQKLGLKKAIAQKLVLQTAKGAGLLAVEAAKGGKGPDVLRKMVTSPGGTTEAAMRVFAKRNFEKTVLIALWAAANRSKQLSR